MDYYNIEHLGRIQAQGTSARIELLGKYDPEGDIIIEDPYFVSYGYIIKENYFVPLMYTIPYWCTLQDNDSSRFEKAYQQCLRSVPIFIERCRLDNQF